MNKFLGSLKDNAGGAFNRIITDFTYTFNSFV